MRANPHFRDGQSLDKALVPCMPHRQIVEPFMLLQSLCEAIKEIEKVPWNGSSFVGRPYGWWGGCG